MARKKLPRHRAWILLGSNIEPEFHLPRARAALAELGVIAAVSSVWESAPVGFLDQPHFLNAAVLLQTSHPPRILKILLREIEEQLGRVRDPENRNAPRTIDLDIALFDSLILDEPEMTIPDPEIEHRPFLAIPLAELDGQAVHPASGLTLSEIAAAWPDPKLIRRDDLDWPP